MSKIKVLIIDDSAVIRNILSSNLSKFEDIEIIGTAADPYEGRDMIVKFRPDVVTLDIEMPKMNGLEFVGVLMEHYPLPVIIVSSLVTGRCDTSLKALELGAIDIFAKPSSDISRNMPLQMADLHNKIIAASHAKVTKRITSGIIKKSSSLASIKASDKIIAIGSSTGGTEAVRKVLEPLPSNIPPVIITQHMPAGFTNSFAKRLNDICRNIEVKEAENNERLINGTALIAPGGFHLLLKRDGAKYKVILKDGPKVCHQKPSADVMFYSVAEAAGKNSIGVILTGMGADGADGLLKMKNKGALTIGQSERTCVVYGMPREAALRGAIDFVEDLENIPEKIVNLLNL